MSVINWLAGLFRKGEFYKVEFVKEQKEEQKVAKVWIITDESEGVVVYDVVANVDSLREVLEELAYPEDYHVSLYKIEDGDAVWEGELTVAEALAETEPNDVDDAAEVAPSDETEGSDAAVGRWSTRRAEPVCATPAAERYGWNTRTGSVSAAAPAAPSNWNTRR